MALAAVRAIGAFATVYRTIGLVVMAIVLVGFLVYVFVNVLFKGKPEVGAEIELAPNRKPYFSDEELGGPKLDRALSWGLITLFVVGVGLPLYWIMEPGRQANATDGFNSDFVAQGAELFDTTENGGLNCAGCHGGMEATGGSAQYTLTKPDGSFDRQVTWRAPALNTVLLRYSREEVTYILTYGRPYSPMPAWGLEGNGPLNAQQVQTLVDYMETIQLTPEEAQAEAEDALRTALGLGEDEEIDYEDPATGEALFNLGFADGFAGGAYACARCHTNGWSYATSLDELESPGCGGFGPNLCDGATVRQFPENEDPAEGESPFQAHIDFITNGSEEGVRYGAQGQGSGRMPGFGLRPEEPGVYWIERGADGPSGPGMLTPEMIQAIVLYERTL
jgi:mono/diheme cytochrome c family protein